MTPGKTALASVSAAVYGVLSADVTLGSLAHGGVWDHVPQDPSWPYVRIGNASEDPDDTSGRQGRRVSLVVHVWSQYRGLAEAYSLLDRIMALLRYTALTLTGGWVHDATKHTHSEVDEPELVDGIQVQHAWAEFEVIVDEGWA